jgi:hypothetical protein
MQNNQDLQSNVKATRVVGPVAIGANGTKTGKIIDRQGYGGVEFICSYGAVTTTGSVCTMVAFEGDVTGTMTSVADADLIGTEALATLPAITPRTSGIGQNVSKRFGYKGIKRYVRVDAVGTGVTSVGCVGVTALLLNPSVAAVSNP